MADARRREALVAPPGWTYRRAQADAIVDVGTVRGQDVALPAHFHDEDQITFIRSGRRRFLIGGETVTVEAGGCVLIRACVVHRSLEEPGGVDGLNLYLPAGVYASSAMINEVGWCWLKETNCEPSQLMGVVARHRMRWKDDLPERAGPRWSITKRAEQSGLTREGFSRAFARERGMPPHAFGLITRLNHARRLFRYGASIADAAFAAGFADQSHLGRCFRRAFGVTPGQYRAG